MKRVKLFSAIVVMAVVLFSCEQLLGTFTASINGNTWNADAVIAAKNGNQYMITATTGSSTIVMTIPGLTPGTYMINPQDTTVEALIYTPNTSTPTEYYLSTQGNLDLAKVESGRVTGTFNVYAKNSVTTTDSIQITGQFSNILSN